MAKFYVGRGRGPRGFDEYIVPIKWMRRFVHKGRMRSATEEEVLRYGIAGTARPVRLLDLPELPPHEPKGGDFIELPPLEAGGAVSADAVAADLEEAQQRLGLLRVPAEAEEPPARPSRKQRSP